MRRLCISVGLYTIFLWGYMSMMSPSIDLLHNSYYFFILMLLYLFQMGRYPDKLFLMHRFNSFEDFCLYLFRNHSVHTVIFLLLIVGITIVTYSLWDISFQLMKIFLYYIHLGLIYSLIGFGVLFDLVEGKTYIYKMTLTIYICLSFLMRFIITEVPMLGIMNITSGLFNPFCFVGIALHGLLLVLVIEKRKKQWFL